MLFVWEQIQDSDHRMYHAHRSFAGLGLVVLRILLAALFAWNLNVTVSSERSALRREFYKSFTKVCKVKVDHFMQLFAAYKAFISRIR